MVQRKKVSDLLGKEFHRYKVIEYLGVGEHSKHYWTCLCQCGSIFKLNTSRITGNTPTTSCGCARVEKLVANRCDPTRHGYSKSHPKLYAIYHGMMYRCYNGSCKRYKYYGGKGIGVCKTWRDNPELFFGWAIMTGYQDGLSIDRKNSDKWYNPYNCEWVTVSENSRRMNVRKHAKAAQRA